LFAKELHDSSLPTPLIHVAMPSHAPLLLSIGTYLRSWFDKSWLLNNMANNFIDNFFAILGMKKKKRFPTLLDKIDLDIESYVYNVRIIHAYYTSYNTNNYFSSTHHSHHPNVVTNFTDCMSCDLWVVSRDWWARRRPVSSLPGISSFNELHNCHGS
jgi:hypothetical protein